MEDRGLNTILSSGEITNIQLGSLDSTETVLTQTQIDAKILSSTPFTPIYEYTKAQDITIVDDTYQETGRLSVVSIPEGTYEVNFAVQWEINSINSSAYLRYSVDDGVTWVQLSREARDLTDKLVWTYGFPTTFTAGSYTILTEMRKETASDTMTVLYNNIMLERKL